MFVELLQKFVVVAGQPAEDDRCAGVGGLDCGVGVLEHLRVGARVGAPAHQEESSSSFQISQAATLPAKRLAIAPAKRA